MVESPNPTFLWDAIPIIIATDRDGESEREEGYLTVSDGIVKFNDDEIGTFTIDDFDKVTFFFHKGASGVEETLSYAAEQGLVLSLQYQPEYGAED